MGLIVEELAGGAVRIAPRGELDLNHAYAFDEELRLLEERHPPCVVLDLRELTFLDSCGMSRILAARARARRAGRKLLLVRGPAPIQRLFALAALNEAFEVVNDVPAALRA